MRRMLPARARFLLLLLVASVLGCSTSDEGPAAAAGARWEERSGLSAVAHFQPSAPDWSGAQFQYRLWAGASIDSGTLDLFAHPPLVRPGAYVPP
jgi:hypothetical protein